MPGSRSLALVFVVNVSSLTERGFAASTSYEGKPVEVFFDDQDKGVFLPSSMADRIGVKKGSELVINVETESVVISWARYSGTSKAPRISDSKTYYSIGREGGAVVRLTKA